MPGSLDPGQSLPGVIDSRGILLRKSRGAIPGNLDPGQSLPGVIDSRGICCANPVVPSLAVWTPGSPCPG
jgi:hypothetical protein